MLAPRRLLPLALAALAACSGGGKKQSAPPLQLHVASPDWRDQVVYFVMIDRFANGDPSNDDQGKGEFDPADSRKFQGGDLKGVQDKLDYIQGLGATAIWITPPVANQWWDPLVQFGGYHGYWARNLEAVDEHFGTLDSYKALSDALHKRGMYLIQDIVPNHMGNYFTYNGPYSAADPTQNVVYNTASVPSAKPTQPPFDQNDVRDPTQRAAAIYHWTPPIANFLDPVQEKTYQVSDLDDLNTENPVVRQALKSSYGYWIQNVGVDAFRVDTVKFVPTDFWNDFFHSTSATEPGILQVAKQTGRNDFWAFGEVFETSAPLDTNGEVKVSSYLGTPAAPALPAVLQFPLYEEVRKVIGTGTPTHHLAFRLQKFMDPAFFPDPYRTPTFIDNHDVERFLGTGTERAMAQALSLIFTLPGVPVVYYGTEQGFKTPRAAMFKGGFGSGGKDHFDTAAAFYGKLKQLADLRKQHPVFTRGTLEVVYDDESGAGGFAYTRTFQGATALVVLNTSENAALVNVPTGLAAGTGLDLLYAEQAPGTIPKVGAGGVLTGVLPPRSVLVFKANATVTPPPAPPATLTVTTPIEGQTFTGDVTLSGTVSPAATTLRMILDDSLGLATNVAVQPDGSWSVVLPVTDFAIGTTRHSVTFYAPAVAVSSARYRFTSDLPFVGKAFDVPDPVGDDTGPAGKHYTYPTDPTFLHQEDLTNVHVAVGTTSLFLTLTMADLTKTWNPSLGFDHTCFNIFFKVPGRTGVTFLPRLQSDAPAGFDWVFSQFTYGFGTNALFKSDGAAPDAWGTPATAPRLSVDPTAKTVTFTYNRNNYGLATWAGVQVYIATWDFDGIDSRYRPLTPDGGPFVMGGGATTDPLIMDDVPPITLPDPLAP